MLLDAILLNLMLCFGLNCAALFSALVGVKWHYQAASILV